MKWFCINCGWETAENAALPKKCGACGKRMSGAPDDDAEEKLKALCEEVRRIMTQVTDAAVLEQLQEAIDQAEA